ncbi:MAG TPA: glycosyltransferase [Stellaceae bacterium]|nr:glycosyltransferase [Stellaceae bacterium]
MNIVFAVHSVASCWNHGNAHFLRGVMTALQAAGHKVTAVEPADGWSRTNLLADAGEAALAAFAAAFPSLSPRLYRSRREALALVEGSEPDLVIVHEWNEPGLVAALGARRKAGARFTLLFHDTHHRALSRPEEILRFDLSGYDGILAFGASIVRLYERLGWTGRVWTWHEAADTRIFRPMPRVPPSGDLVWVGNWGDGERSAELREFLLEPATALRLRATIYGVRYPDEALAELTARGIRHGGWLANHRVPAIFATHRVTVHVPRRPYVEALPGIPTIRVFEALACGIPLVSAPWSDDEGLFPAGAFLTARDGQECRRHLAAVLADDGLAEELRRTGLACIRERHTCDHRAAEVLAVHAAIAGPPRTERAA